MLAKCDMCGKKQKENTYGVKGYCQGHTFFSRMAFAEQQKVVTKPVAKATKKRSK